MQLTRALAGPACLALGLIACDGSPALTSDPNSWSPRASPFDGAVGGPGDGGVVVDARCLELPEHDDTVLLSTAGAVSHASGQPCLEGCHESAGSARSVFAVGGTVFRSQTSRVVAESGVVGVGGILLDVDACGNIYAKEDQLAGRLTATAPPYVAEPTYRRMDKSLRGTANPGSCNQSGCHDFSSRLRWGIYF